MKIITIAESRLFTGPGTHLHIRPPHLMEKGKPLTDGDPVIVLHESTDIDKHHATLALMREEMQRVK